MNQTFDYLLLGGGLQNCLLALALSERRQESSVALVERAARLGGNHTWCFHAADVLPSEASWVDTLVVKRWPGYVVSFPSSERHLDEPYSALTSVSLHDAVAKKAASSKNLKLFLGEAATAMDSGSLTLASGARLSGEVFVDARGPEAADASNVAGFQKFVGLELSVAPDSAPPLPTLMDARVAQIDGFRFFYVLPLAPGRVLVEDTTFSDSPALDCARLRAAILEYASSIGLRVERVLREEVGVLPLPRRMTREIRPASNIIQGGYQGGWFHPTTGYSFPLAMRLARTIAGCPPTKLAQEVERLARERDRQQRYCTLLNRLLFDAFEPEERFHVFERFYRLPAPTVRRFYALTLSRTDRVRILCGRPPQGFRTTRLLNRPRARVVQKRSIGGNAWSKP